MAETPTPDPLLFDPGLPPSSSLLFYLFAERVAPSARRGTRAPLADVRVQSAPLACALFAVAFWQLREAGLVRLELVHEQHFLKSSTRLRVTRTSIAESQRDGIEA